MNDMIKQGQSLVNPYKCCGLLPHKPIVATFAKQPRLLTSQIQYADVGHMKQVG